jgi:ribonuclease R
MSTQKPADSDSSPADPMAEREAQKYEHPVPSREAVLSHLAECGEPLSLKRLAQGLGVEGERDIESFSRRLRAMERDGQLLKNRRGRYALIDKMDMVRGRVIGHPDGFGFLVPDEGGEDLFLSPREMRQLLHGDRAVARVAGVDPRGRKEGAIIEVLERAHRTVVGRYVQENAIGVVVPSDKRINQDILIPQGAAGDARDGQIVVAAIVEQPSRRGQPQGKIVEVLGDHMAPGMEIEVAIRMYELPHEWPDAVQGEVSGLDPQVPESAKHGREDLRATPLVTIDGEDARDFDDAVFCERVGKGFRLIVAIADVASYVKPGSALDAEAYQRGNSVYFPNHVIPMLPEILSNGLCSLNPEVDRLCMACEMKIGARGRIEDFGFFEAVMRSQARLTYTQVAAMLVDGDAALRRQYAPLVPQLENLYALYQVLHEARAKRGAVDFELPETRIVYNAERKIERIEPVVRNDAHKLIEECMLAANVCAAEFLIEHKMPVPFRVHAGPTPEKLAALREFLSELGLELGGGDEPQARDYARLLAAVGERPDARLIHTVMLRSLSQAIYSPDNIGHFALGYPNYAHFTSPIRRYPDLIVHRAIKSILQRRPARITDAEALGQGEHLSVTERRADDATRDVIRWLKAEYMQDKIGEEFEGLISGVTSFGLFVELAEIYVDGLVHISSLGNDYYHFDAAKHRLIGERSNEVFRLGDPLKVRVVRVDLDEAKLDFELVARAASPDGGRTRGGRRGKHKTAKPARAAAAKTEPGKAGKRRGRSKRRRR